MQRSGIESFTYFTKNGMLPAGEAQEKRESQRYHEWQHMDPSVLSATPHSLPRTNTPVKKKQNSCFQCTMLVKRKLSPCYLLSRGPSKVKGQWPLGGALFFIQFIL